ncbi:heavy metal-binding domain-containing protein [Singulisphaera rosea]
MNNSTSDATNEDVFGVVESSPATRFSRAVLALRAIQVRMRFLVILAVSFAVAGQWETVKNHGDRFRRGLFGPDAHAPSISTDTEYFCPMDPGVVSAWPSKCGICNMALVRRKMGEATPLPSGVLARMQLSPYRIQLAGIRTAAATYQPLVRERSEVVAVRALVAPRTLEVERLERDPSRLEAGQAVVVTLQGEEGPSSLAGRIDTASPLPSAPAQRPHLNLILKGGTVPADLRPGSKAKLTVRTPVAELEPFRSMPVDAPAIREKEPRAVYLCPEHSEVLADRKGKCPVDGRNELERHGLLKNQRLAWWCPMHPSVVADHPGPECRECGGMKLVPRVVTYRPPGQVLAVPESAVVDTGSKTVVYVERMPGMFDGVEVVLGPRVGDAYPVIKGLDPGQAVAIAGAFLVDAETRLNPSLAASYFGSGSGRNSHTAETHKAAEDPRSGLSPEDQAIVSRQKICPVTGKPLGSMGTPVKVTVTGKDVMICCEGCESRLKKDPKAYLSKIP